MQITLSRVEQDIPILEQILSSCAFTQDEVMAMTDTINLLNAIKYTKADTVDLARKYLFN